ncbi:MAG: flap endonuclease [Acidimicrobiia bacterium]|nr:flap endonuclease [Acidimicrobiia bacterium]
MQVHLVDGTYELFRHFFAVPSRENDAGEEVGAARGVVRWTLNLLEQGATHVGVATDHVIESWRNDLWATYKDGSGVDPVLKGQFILLEDALASLGVAVWAMVEDEADDALASAAWLAGADERVDRVEICTVDKDLAQCVGGTIVQADRRREVVLDADGVREKYGVDPASIPDWLALVGDSADGFPGLKGWGKASAAAVLRRYRRIDEIPADGADWDVGVRNARGLAATLVRCRDEATLFKVLATLRSDCEVGAVDDWRWTGPADGFEAMAERLAAPDLARRASALAEQRA